MGPIPTPSTPLFGFSNYKEARRISTILRKETVGGALLVLAASLAILLANSPWSSVYFNLRDFTIGYEPWHLNLSLGAWAADGLLAIFFFLVGLELKREIVAGDLRQPRKAMVPVAAALGGVVVPALIYFLVNLNNPDAHGGWAIPTATDIAFAVAVLAIIGSHLPTSLRIFLLTLAVVDDLLAITIIAIFYTEHINTAALALALIPLALYGFLAQKYQKLFHMKAAAAWVILLPLGFITWVLIHASGIHATVAGVLLAFTIPVLRAGQDTAKSAEPGLAEIFEHRFRPLSAGFAVPVFAFFSGGVALGGFEGLSTALENPVSLGIILALVVGKPVGILLATWCTARWTYASLDPQIRWIDLTGVSLLAGIGFTVSLLIGELSFGLDTTENDHAKVAILTASLLAALLAAVVLGSRNHVYRKISIKAGADENNDGIPDVYQQHD